MNPGPSETFIEPPIHSQCARYVLTLLIAAQQSRTSSVTGTFVSTGKTPASPSVRPQGHPRRGDRQGISQFLLFADQPRSASALAYQQSRPARSFIYIIFRPNGTIWIAG